MIYRWFKGSLTMLFLPGMAAANISISIDYSTDTGDFFASGSEARASLEAAVSVYESLVTDDFLAITPAVAWGAPSGNQWIIDYVHPSTGVTTTDGFFTAPADTLVLHVGARNFTTSVAEAGYGGFGWSGTLAFGDIVENRGEAGLAQGPTATEYAPWGGYLSVDSVGTLWHTNHLTAPTGSEVDLYSILLHELGHVFGIGTAASWDVLASGTPGSQVFTGAASVAAFGGFVPLHTDDSHWDENTMSNVYLGGATQEAALDPNLTVGTRKLLTDLDVAALDDIGWDLLVPVPEPSSLFLVAVALVFGVFVQSRRPRREVPHPLARRRR